MFDQKGYTDLLSQKSQPQPAKNVAGAPTNLEPKMSQMRGPDWPLRCLDFSYLKKKTYKSSLWTRVGRKTVIKEDWCLREKDLSEFDSQSQSLTSCVKLETAARSFLFVEYEIYLSKYIIWPNLIYWSNLIYICQNRKIYLTARVKLWLPVSN